MVGFVDDRLIVGGLEQAVRRGELKVVLVHVVRPNPAHVLDLFECGHIYRPAFGQFFGDHQSLAA